jgi:hypothetical protein
MDKHAEFGITEPLKALGLAIKKGLVLGCRIPGYAHHDDDTGNQEKVFFHFQVHFDCVW